MLWGTHGGVQRTGQLLAHLIKAAVTNLGD